MARKRGKLSLEEEQFIRESIGQLDIRNIALQINRTEKTVKKYCDENNLTYSGMSEEAFDDVILRAQLEERPYWAEVQQQFTDQELEYFTQTWIRIVKQFREDILYSEELQVKQWITLDMMGNKVLRDRKAAQQQVNRLENTLQREYNAPEDVRDTERIAGLETELSMIRNAQVSYTHEYTKIQEKIERIQKDLKMARADRIKKIEDSKSSWAGFLRALEDEELRQRIGEDIEIGKMAKDKSVERLSKFHKYEDGQVDQPFLNANTLRQDD